VTLRTDTGSKGQHYYAWGKLQNVPHAFPVIHRWWSYVIECDVQEHYLCAISMKCLNWAIKTLHDSCELVARRDCFIE